MGNICESINNNIKFYYVNNTTFNKATVSHLYDKNKHLLTLNNIDSILPALKKIMLIVKEFNIEDKLKFFNKCVNVTDHYINITKACSKNYITDGCINVELYYMAINELNILMKDIHVQKKMCSISNKYDISVINFNFIIDSILLSLYNLINHRIIDKQAFTSSYMFKKCISCNNTGYYNKNGIYNNNSCYCKLHKTNDMRCIDLTITNDISELSNDERLCIICMEDERRIIFTPCGHIIICESCLHSHEFTNCCLCNKKIFGKYKLYL